MPVHYNDGLDDQLAYDLTGSFVGGQVSSVRSNLLKDSQYSESKNMDIDKFGSIITRRGTEIVGATISEQIDGLTFFDKPAVEELLAVADGTLYKSTGGSWSTLSGYSPSAGSNVEFAQLVDVAYMTDNSGNVHSYDGTTVSDELHTSTDPPRGKYLINHTNRLFMANTENYDDELAASDLLDGGTWPAAFKIRIGGGEGDPITGISSWYNFILLVFKTRSIHMVTTNPAEASGSSWRIDKIDDSVGCVSHRTIAQAGADVIFLARDGVRTIRTILSGAQSSVSEPISSPIGDFIERVNWGYAHTSCAKVWNNRYILSVPMDSSTTTNYTFVFNLITKSWSGYWTGWTPMIYGVSTFSDFPKMVFGDSTGKVLTWLDHIPDGSVVPSTYQDDGDDYESMLLSRGHVFGDYLSPKLGNHADIELASSNVGCNCAEIFVSLDEAAGIKDKLLASMVNTQADLVELPVDLPFDLPTLGAFQRAFNLTTLGEFSEAQFRVKAASGRLTVRSIKASAYINTMALEK